MPVVSATEAALENQRLGGLQMRVAALCTLVQVCDGYDLNAVAWAVPSLIRTWHLPPPMFTMAFLWSSVGILVGALSAGPIGEAVRHGIEVDVTIQPATADPPPPGLARRP